MADRYLITGGGSVNWNSTGSWSATDGGSTGASFPVAGDNAFMTAASGAGTLTVNVASACADLNCSGFTGTLAGSQTLAIGGSRTWGSGMTLSYSGTVTYNATTTGKTLTSNGKSSTNNITFNGVGGGWTLADALTTTGTLTVTAGAFSDGGFTITAGVFTSNSGTTRSVTKTGNWNITSTGNVWNHNATGITWSDTAGTITLTNSSATSRTFSTGVATYNNLSVSAGTGTLTGSISGGTIFNTLDFTGYSGNVPVWGSTILTGNLKLGTGMTFTDGGQAFTMQSTSASTTITSNGVTINHPVSINNTAGVITSLVDAINTGTRNISVNQGIFTDNGFGVTAFNFNSNTNLVRVINKSGTWTATGTGANTAVIQGQNITMNDTAGDFVFSDSSATARTTIFAFNSSGSSGSIKSQKITGGTGTFTIGGASASSQGSMDFTGFKGSVPAGNFSLYGNLILDSGMTMTDGNNAINMTGTSGIQTITTNGVSINRNLSINGVGGTTKPLDDLNLGARNLVLNFGTFDANNKNITALSFSSLNSNVRTLTMGSGTWTLSGAGSSPTNGGGIPWQLATITNLTFNKGTATIKLTDTSANKKDFNSGGLNYYKLWVAGSGGGPTFIGGGGSFDTLKVDGNRTLNFSISVASTSIGAIDFGGSAGNLVTLQSDTAGTTYTLKNTNGAIFSTDYLSVQDCIGTDGMKWFAGIHSTNAGNNSGWAFCTAPQATQHMFK